MSLKIRGLTALRFRLKINWKVAVPLLAAAIFLFVLMNPFEKKYSAWDFYEDMVMGYEAIEEVELSELEGELKEVVKRRNDCYGNISNLSPRLSICRKHYLSEILALARQNIKSAPDLGKFMLCVRECPLAYSMCAGTEIEEININSECTIKEIQCIELCLDRYWRGTN